MNSKIDQFAVGGVFGTSAMGRYSVAADLAASPLEEVNTPMLAVLYPVMSRVKDDLMQVRGLYLRTLAWSAIVCAAIGVGVTLVAHDLVLVVLGPQWASAEPLMAWLALSAGLVGLSSGAYATFDAIGRPQLGARMQWTRLVMLGITIVPAVWLLRSSETIAAIRLAVTAAFMPTLFIAVARSIGLGVWDYFHVLWRPAVAAASMALLLWIVNGEIASGPLRLLVDVLAGSLSFTITLLACWMLTGCPDSPEAAVAKWCIRTVSA